VFSDNTDLEPIKCTTKERN